MKLGIGLFTTQRPENDVRSTKQRYRQTVDLVRLAEREGFDSAWVSEHHGTADEYLPSLFPMCGAMAEATNHITIGTSLALAPFYHPIRLAEDAAVVDLLSGGRFQLGLGIGYRDPEFDMFDVSKSERVPRLVDCVRVCRRAWTGEAFDYDGNVFQFENARVTPRPAQGADLPILIGGFAEAAVRRAARIGDGYIAGGDSMDVIEEQFGWVSEEAGDSFPTYLLRDAFVGESKDDAWNKMEDGIRHTKSMYAQWIHDESDTTDVERNVDRSLILHGDPDQLAQEIIEFDDLLGEESHLILRMDHPGLSYDVLTSAIETIGSDVIPQLS